MQLENNELIKNTKGCIEVIVGSMFSGKTEELIRRLKRAQLANQNIQIFKPGIDTRYSKTRVVSHDERSLKSVIIKTSSDILKKVKTDTDVIGFDEAQFLDDSLVSVCSDLANNEKRVIVAGLDMDYTGLPFDPMPRLMAVAEYITKLHAICMKCGNPALHSHRKIDKKELVLIGAKKEYEPLCRHCFLKTQKHGHKKKI